MKEPLFTSFMAILVSAMAVLSYWAGTDRFVEEKIPIEQRWLTCAEDEDIVVSLGEDGLPFSFCEQVSHHKY